MHAALSTTEIFLIALLLIFTIPYLIWRGARTDYYAPLVVVQIVGGILLGPGVLGAVAPEGFGCEFSQFISRGGNLNLSEVENPMHNKYCIIDNEILINGSYNWTYYAETKNEENVIIFDNCPDLIAAFTNDFNRLKNITKKGIIDKCTKVYF